MRDGQVDWPALIDRLGLAAMARELASNSTLIELGSDVCRIGLDPRLEETKSPRSIAALERSLQQHLARPITLVIEMIKEEMETPAKQQQKADHHRRENASTTIEQDPVIRALVDDMGGRLVPGSLQSKDT